MAKVIYLQEIRGDYSTIHFFRNQKDSDAYKDQLLQDEEFVQDMKDGFQKYNQGTFMYNKGLAFFAGDVGDGNFYDGDKGPDFRNMTEADFRAQVEKHIEVFDAGRSKGPGALLYFKGAIKPGTEIYMDSRSGVVVDKGTQPTISVENGQYDIGESAKTAFKYISTFESFRKTL